MAVPLHVWALASPLRRHVRVDHLSHQTCLGDSEGTASTENHQTSRKDLGRGSSDNMVFPLPRPIFASNGVSIDAFLQPHQQICHNNRFDTSCRHFADIFPNNHRASDFPVAALGMLFILMFPSFHNIFSVALSLIISQYFTAIFKR